MDDVEVTGLSAVTLVVVDMAASTAFYDAVGLPRRYGGPTSAFTSYALGSSFLNLQAGDPGTTRTWGRVIVHVTDVDAMWHRARAAGGEPDGQPEDASWGERYFHVRDPDGHELSFAKPL